MVRQDAVRLHALSRRDLVLTLSVAALGGVEVAVGQVTGPVWATAGSVLVLSAPLAWRCRYPWTTLVVVLGAVLGLHLAGANQDSYLASVASVLLVLFSFASTVELGAAVAGLVLAAGVLVVSALHGIPGVLWGVGLLAGAWAAGRAIQSRRLLIEQLRRSTEELQRNQDARARAAMIEERTQIARDLHDVIAHSVSVMVVQAGAAERMAPLDAVRAGQAARSVQDTGRQALAELRRMLGVLRPTAGIDVDRTPQPGLGDLVALVDGLHDAGLRVELTRTGQVRELSPGAELAAYRIVQEALTNVLKHAAAAPTTVFVSYLPDAVDLQIVNTGVVAAAHPAGENREGHGLAGMRERAQVYGGTFAAGPCPQGGFAVRARLPACPE